jgi:hypothetical protein
MVRWRGHDVGGVIGWAGNDGGHRSWLPVHSEKSPPGRDVGGVIGWAWNAGGCRIWRRPARSCQRTATGHG